MKDAERGRPSPETSAGAEGPGQSLRWAQAGVACVLGLILLGFWVYVDFVRPAPFYTIKYDPEMPYFMNSLAIFKSQPYGYIDHPGTPVEVVGTGILVIIKAAMRLPSDEFVPWMVAHPEVFLRWAHGLLAAGSALGIALVVLIGRPVRRWKDLAAAASAAALFFAVHPDYSLETVAYWSQNSLAFPVGTLILVLLWVRLREATGIPFWEVILWGLAAGVLTAVQLYFATWIVGVGIALGIQKGLQTRNSLRGVVVGLAVGLAGMTGFLLATQPVLHRYRELFWWVKGLIVHQGRYAGGPLGVTSLERLRDNLIDLGARGGGVVLASSFVALILIGAAMVARRRIWDTGRGWWAAAIGTSVQLLVTTFLILKHPGQTYLLALAAILPVHFLLLAEGLGDKRPVPSALAGLATLLIGIGFLLSIAQAVGAHERRIRIAALTEAEIGQLVTSHARAAGRLPNDIVILWGYGTSSRCYAVRFGNSYVGGLFAEEIRELCPTQWVFNDWDQAVELPHGREPFAQATGWDILAILDRRLSEATSDLDLVFRSSDTGVAYLVRPATSPPP